MLREIENIFFFFSSRRRHTRYWRDWSSDVCSSDLGEGLRAAVRADLVLVHLFAVETQAGDVESHGAVFPEIGRAACWERVEISVVAVSLKKKIDIVAIRYHDSYEQHLTQSAHDSLR